MPEIGGETASSVGEAAMQKKRISVIWSAKKRHLLMDRRKWRTKVATASCTLFKKAQDFGKNKIRAR